MDDVGLHDAGLREFGSNAGSNAGSNVASDVESSVRNRRLITKLRLRMHVSFEM